MLLSCHINLIKFEKFWLSKIFKMTYNLERREYLFVCAVSPLFSRLLVTSRTWNWHSWQRPMTHTDTWHSVVEACALLSWTPGRLSFCLQRTTGLLVCRYTYVVLADSTRPSSRHLSWSVCKNSNSWQTALDTLLTTYPWKGIRFIWNRIPIISFTIF